MWRGILAPISFNVVFGHVDHTPVEEVSNVGSVQVLATERL